MASSAKEMRRRRTKRTPTVLEQLVSGCDADRVSVHFLDGTVREGALLFNAIKRSGKLINIEQEFSLDFMPQDVREIRILRARSIDPTGEASGDDSDDE